MPPGLMIGLCFAAIGLIVAASRKATSTVREKPSSLLEFSTPMPPEKVLRVVVKFAQQSGYVVDDINEDDGRIILSDKASGTSWGFFYPVYVASGGQGRTVVEVGIKSKAIQVGPVKARLHEQCFNGIKAAVFAES